jgi:hypothetical protein
MDIPFMGTAINSISCSWVSLSRAITPCIFCSSSIYISVSGVRYFCSVFETKTILRVNSMFQALEPSWFDCLIQLKNFSLCSFLCFCCYLILVEVNGAILPLPQQILIALCLINWAHGQP